MTSEELIGMYQKHGDTRKNNITIKLIKALETVEMEGCSDFLILHDNLWFDTNFVKYYFKKMDKNVNIIPVSNNYVPEGHFYINKIDGKFSVSDIEKIIEKGDD